MDKRREIIKRHAKPLYEHVGKIYRFLDDTRMLAKDEKIILAKRTAQDLEDVCNKMHGLMILLMYDSMNSSYVAWNGDT